MSWRDALMFGLPGPDKVATAIGGVADARRPAGPTAEQNIAGLLGSIRALGGLREKQAYRTGLDSAAERGVAAGAGGGTDPLSGLGHQTIDPMVAEEQMKTEQGVQSAIGAEKARIEDVYQREEDRKAQKEANKPKGIFGPLLG